MNRLFIILISLSFVSAGIAHWHWNPSSVHLSPMQAMSDEIIATAQNSIMLMINLTGVLCLFLGLTAVGEKAGLLNQLGHLLNPLLIRLFPEVPPHHPAMGAIGMNLSANMLGLGNAATPFGIKAMQGLNQLNPHPGYASNSMILFLAINTSSITLLPIKVIALRAAAGSVNAAGIVPTTLFATLCSTIAAIIVSKILNHSFRSSPCGTIASQQNINSDLTSRKADSIWKSITFIICLVSFIPLTIFLGEKITPWLIPSLITFIIIYGGFKKINVYESFVMGAKEGISVALNIVPYLLVIMVAIAMFRSSGLLANFISALSPLTETIGLPAEALPMALLRPLSGSGSFGVLADVLNDPNFGPDSYVGYLVSTLMGSTETTFYVLAVYFGSVQIKHLRHALVPALIADGVAIMSSVFIVSWLFK